MSMLPSLEDENAMLQQVYDDVNDLYTDEHLIMTQADMLEQLYQQVAAMHSITNKRELVEDSRRQGWLEARKVDPDSFPINKLSEDLVRKYVSIWQ
jgi:hypothetical protein